MATWRERLAVLPRRLAESLKKQNLTGHGLEFVIVVLGVFIGIQVSNWNDDRLENERRAEAYEALQSEFERNISSVRDRYGRDRERTEAEQQMSRALADGTLDAGERETIDRDMAQMMYFAPVIVRDSTFESLRQSGELSLIDNHEVLASLLEFSADVEWIEGQQASFRNGMTGLEGEWFDYVFHTATDNPLQTAVTVDAGRLVADRRAVSAISNVVRMKSIFLGYVAGLITSAEQTCALLARETGRPCDPEAAT